MFTHTSISFLETYGASHWLLQPELVLPRLSVSCQDLGAFHSASVWKAPRAAVALAPVHLHRAGATSIEPSSHIQVLVEPSTFLFFISVAMLFPGLPSHLLSTQSSCAQQATPRFVAHHSLDPFGQRSDVLLRGNTGDMNRLGRNRSRSLSTRLSSGTCPPLPLTLGFPAPSSSPLSHLPRLRFSPITSSVI